MAGDSRRSACGRSRKTAGAALRYAGRPAYKGDRLARSVLDGGSEQLDDAVHPELLDEDVVAALVLRDDVIVEMTDARDALLARDQCGVQLGPIPLVVEHDDIEPQEIDLARRHPAYQTRALPERTAEADGDVDDVALRADARVLIRVRDRRTGVAGVSESIVILIGLTRIRHEGTIVADVADVVTVRIGPYDVGTRPRLRVAEVGRAGIPVVAKGPADAGAVELAGIAQSARIAVVARQSQGWIVEARTGRVVDEVDGARVPVVAPRRHPLALPAATDIVGRAGVPVVAGRPVREDHVIHAVILSHEKARYDDARRARALTVHALTAGGIARVDGAAVPVVATLRDTPAHEGARGGRRARVSARAEVAVIAGRPGPHRGPGADPGVRARVARRAGITVVARRPGRLRLTDAGPGIVADVADGATVAIVAGRPRRQGRVLATTRDHRVARARIVVVTIDRHVVTRTGRRIARVGRADVEVVAGGTAEERLRRSSQGPSPSGRRHKGESCQTRDQRQAQCQDVSSPHGMFPPPEENRRLFLRAEKPLSRKTPCGYIYARRARASTGFSRGGSGIFGVGTDLTQRLADEVPGHLLAPAQAEVGVVDRFGERIGEAGGFLDGLLRDGTADEGGLGFLRLDGGHRHGAEPQAGVGDDLAVETGAGGHAEHRKVERLAAAQLAVGRAPARRRREGDAGEDLVRALRQVIDPVAPVEIPRLDRARAFLRDQLDPRAVGAQDRGGVARGHGQADVAPGRDPADIAVALHAEVDGAAPLVVLVVVVAPRVEADVAADRPHVPEDRGRDRMDRLVQARVALPENGALLEIGQDRRGTDPQSARGASLDAPQHVDLPETDERLRGLMPAFHVGVEVGAAGDDHSLGPFTLQDRGGLAEGGGGVVTEPGKPHHGRAPRISGAPPPAVGPRPHVRCLPPTASGPGSG